ncbi:hypothetical protein [Methylobacterium isbiliense]|jgi:hypothetical protein|uniref:hypothetical protein n=1 Tax=Methylobacterium isbiliense TaxID=315478 RepID=UPI001EE332D5|nr:hypothetical protein [Methylobacterium isbiliense]MDN3622445.1 hypothetical protein [Methylobacterium isbiliense]
MEGSAAGSGGVRPPLGGRRPCSEMLLQNPERVNETFYQKNDTAETIILVEP